MKISYLSFSKSRFCSSHIANTETEDIISRTFTPTNIKLLQSNITVYCVVPNMMDVRSFHCSPSFRVSTLRWPRLINKVEK